MYRVDSGKNGRSKQSSTPSLLRVLHKAGFFFRFFFRLLLGIFFGKASFLFGVFFGVFFRLFVLICIVFCPFAANDGGVDTTEMPIRQSMHLWRRLT